MKIIDCSKIVDLCKQYENELNSLAEGEAADFIREYYNYKTSIEIHRLLREAKLEIEISCPVVNPEEQEDISHELFNVFEKRGKVPCSIFIKEVVL